MTVAALFVETNGCYFGLPGVEPWDRARDARTYAGPHPVVAHPPCERWGRYWHGSPRKPHQFRQGDDGGCFATALHAVRIFGGVLEHPADSYAWKWFQLTAPPRAGGWVKADWLGGWTCYVEQCFYGHPARKGAWLYAHGAELPSLRWGKGEQRLSPIALARHGYEKARRAGVMAYFGGADKAKKRAATPPAFRDLLLSIARSVSRVRNAKTVSSKLYSSMISGPNVPQVIDARESSESRFDRMANLNGRTAMLYKPNNDVRSRAFCGPTAISSVTGLPISLIRDAVRQVSGRVETASGAKHPVMGMRNEWLKDAMALLGWRIVEEGRPPQDRVYRLGHFCEARGGEGPFIVQVTGHYVAVGFGEICDTFTGLPLDICDYKRRMGRWVEWWWKFERAAEE